MNFLCLFVLCDGWDLCLKDVVDKYGFNVLFWVVGVGYVECVEFFVEKCCMNF